MLLAAIVQQQPPPPRAAVVHGDSGTVAVWSERDSAWIYLVSPRGNAAIRIDLPALPRVADSVDRTMGVSPDSAKVLREPPPLNRTLPNTFFDYQVEQQAKEPDKTPEPHYPDQLKAGRVAGKVKAQFIIDSTGKPVLGSFKVLESSHPLFTLAIFSALADRRFEPARVGGQPVAELVQVPFGFGPRTPSIRIGKPDASAEISFRHDSAWLVLTTARGTFALHADSFTMAAWADSAAHVRAPTPHGSKKTDFSEVVLSYPDSSVHATVAMGILRLTADSAPPYQISGANGAWEGSLWMPYDSAQRLFAAMRGSPSTLSVWEEGWPVFDPLHLLASARFEQRAGLKPDSRTPGYPEALRERRIEGTVLMQFWVDTTGVIDMSSVRVLKSAHPLFAYAVYQAMPDIRYNPAVINGKKTRELVQQPYAFNLRW